MCGSWQGHILNPIADATKTTDLEQAFTIHPNKSLQSSNYSWFDYRSSCNPDSIVKIYTITKMILPQKWSFTDLKGQFPKPVLWSDCLLNLANLANFCNWCRSQNSFKKISSAVLTFISFIHSYVIYTWKPTQKNSHAFIEDPVVPSLPTWGWRSA